MLVDCLSHFGSVCEYLVKAVKKKPQKRGFPITIVLAQCAAKRNTLETTFAASTLHNRSASVI